MTATNPNPPAPTDKPSLDLSVAKIAGGALAAVTTALAASFLGVNGTLTGAAFGSVMSSIAAAIYATSLKTASTRIRTTRTLVLRPAAGTLAASAGKEPDDPTAVPAELTGLSVPLPGERSVAPEVGATHAATTYRARRRPAWKPLVVLAVSAFVLAMGAISLVEGVLGHPVASASGSGTTLSRVVGGGAPASSTAPAETTSATTSDSSSASDSATTSASSSASDSPSPSGSSAPSPSDSPAPSAGPAPSPSASPTDSAAAGGAASPTASPVG